MRDMTEGADTPGGSGQNLQSGSGRTPFRRLSRTICHISTGRIVLGSLMLWLVFLALIQGRPFGIAALQDITGGATILDMTFTQSPDDVYAVLDALGEAGRVFDLLHIVPLDLIFPATYMLFLSVGISWTLARWLNRDSQWFLLNLTPIIAGIADYCENAGVITLLLTYPARLDPVAWYTSIMYIVKFGFSTVSFLTLFAALAIWGVFVLKHYLQRNPVA